MSREQAERITGLITEQLCSAKESIGQAFVSKAHLEKVSSFNSIDAHDFILYFISLWVKTNFVHKYELLCLMIAKTRAQIQALT